MRSLVGFGLCAFLSLAACNGEAIGGVGADSGPGNPDSSSDAQVHPDGAADAQADAPIGKCCPIDPAPSGCMQMGGTNQNDGASCAKSCDFFCSENWRVEKDENGCDEWRYDVRQPKPGEGPQCQPLDAGPSVDGGRFTCGTTTCDAKNEYCYATYGGGKQQDSFICKPFPTGCAFDDLCQCVEPGERPGCDAMPGLITCQENTGGVIVGCAL